MVLHQVGWEIESRVKRIPRMCEKVEINAFFLFISHFEKEIKIKRNSIKKNIDTGWTCVLCDQSKRKRNK